MAEIETELSEQELNLSLFEVFKTEESREVIPFLFSQFIGFFVVMALVQLYPLYLQKVTPLPEEVIVIRWATVVSVYTLAGIFARIPTGWFVEKMGRKISIVISFGLMGGAVFGLIFTTRTVWIAILFVFIRFANNMFGLTSRSLVSDLRSNYKGLYNSLTSSSGRLGNLVGTIGLGFVLEFLPSITLLLTILVFIVLGLIVFRLLFVDGKAEMRHFTRRVDIKQGKKIKFDWTLLTEPTFLFFSFSFTLFGIMSGLTNPLFSLFGKNVLDLSESLAGTLLGLSQLSFVVISPIVGWIISNKQKMVYPMLILASILSTINLLIFYIFYNNVAIYTIFLFTKNIGHALFFPVVFTILTFDLPKEHFSILYSVTTTLFFAGYSATSYLAGLLYNKAYNLPWFYAMIAAAILSIAVILFSLLQQEKLKQKKGDKDQRN